MSINNTNTNKINVNISEALLGALDKMKSAAGGVIGSAPAAVAGVAPVAGVAGVAPAETGGFFSGVFMKILFYLILFGIIAGVIAVGIPLLLEHFQSFLPDFLAGIVDEYVGELSEFLEHPIDQLTETFEEGVDGIVNGATDITRAVAGIIPEDVTEGGRNALNAITFMFDDELDAALTHDRYVWALPSETGRSIEEDAELLTNCESVGSNINSKYYNKKCYLINNEEHGISTLTDDDKLYEAGQEPVKYDPDIRLVNMRFSPLYSLTDLDVNYRTRAMHKDAAIESGELVDRCTLITTKTECDSNDECNWTSADGSDPNDDFGTCSVIENPICSNHNSSMNSSCNANSDLNTDTNCHNNIEICDTLDDDGNYVCKYNPSTQRCETVPIYTLNDKYNIQLPGRTSESEHYIGCTIDNDESTMSNLETISSLPGLKNYNTGIVSEEMYAQMNDLEFPLNTCGLTSYTHLVYTTNDLGANRYNLTNDCENGEEEGNIRDNDCNNWTNTKCYNDSNGPTFLNDYDAFSLQDMIPKTFRNMFCYEYDDPRTLEGMDGEITDPFVSLQTNNEVAKALRNSDGCGDAEGTIRGEQDPEILSTWNPGDAEDPCTSLNSECEAIQYNINGTNHNKCVRKPERICNPDIDCESYNNNRDLCENSYLGNKFCIWNQNDANPDEGECQNLYEDDIDPNRKCVNIHDSRCEHIGINENNYKQNGECDMPQTTMCEPSSVGKSFGEDFPCTDEAGTCPLNYIKDGDICKYNCLSNSSIDSVYNCPYCVLNTESEFSNHFDVNFEFNWFTEENDNIQPVDSTSDLVYDNTNSSHITLDISIDDYQGKESVINNIFSTYGANYGIIRSGRPTDLEGNYPQGEGISINNETGAGWENTLLRRQCKSGYTCSEGGNGLNNTCRDSTRITSVSNAELQNTLCFNGRANGGDYDNFNFGEYDRVEFDAPIPGIIEPNPGTGEQLRCSRTENTSTLYKQNRGYSPIIQNLFNIGGSGTTMINQAPFLESTATQLTDDGKSKYLQRCINNPEVHQTADTFIECKFDENNNCPDDIDTITNKPKCIHIGEFNANTIYNPSDNVGVSYDSASLDPTSSDSPESFSEKYIELGLHCESPGYHHDDYSKAKCIAKRYKYSKETLLNLERYLNIYLSKPSPGQPEGQDPVNLDGLNESNISTELFDDRPGKETSVIGNIHPCAAEDGYLNYMEYLRDLKDSNSPYKMELYKKIICQLNTGRNEGEPCQTELTTGSVLPSIGASDNIKKAWVTAGEPKYKMNDTNDVVLNDEPYTLDDYSNDILNKYANYNILSETDKRELQNNYRKVYGNMGEQLCLYKVDREPNNNIENRNYFPFLDSNVEVGGLYENRNEILCSDCLSGVGASGDDELCLIPKCTTDQRGRTNEMCNYDGSCRCSAFNEPENFYHYNEETNVCENTTCSNGSTLLYKNDNNNVAFKDDQGTPLCDCREESGTMAGGYFGPQCNLNNEDSVNGCHGQSQVWEFSVHGTDYKEIDYIRDKINLQDEEGLIHLKLVDYLRLRTLYALGHNSEGLPKEELKHNIELFFDNLRTHNNKPTLPYNIFETIPDSHELILFGNSDVYKNEEYDLFRFPYTLKEILAEVHERGDLYSPTNNANKDNYLFPNHRSNSEIDNQNPSYSNIRSLDGLFYYFYKNTRHGPTFCDCTKDSSGESNISSGGDLDSQRWYYKYYNFSTSVPEEHIVGQGANQKHYRGKNKSHNWGFRCENTTDCQPEPGLGYGGYPIFSSLGHSLYRVLGGRQDVSFLINDGMKIFNDENGEPKYTNDNVIGQSSSHDGFYMSERGLNAGWLWPGTHEVIDTRGCKYFDPETFESTDCAGDTKMIDIARPKSGLNLSSDAEIYDFNSRELAQLYVSNDSGRLPNFIDPKGHSPLLCDCSKSVDPWTDEVNYNKQPQAPTFGDYCQAPLITAHDNPNNFDYNAHFNDYPDNIYDIINDNGSVSPDNIQNGVCYRDGLISGEGAQLETRRIYTDRSVSRKVMAPEGDCGRVGEMTLEYLLDNESACASNPSQCFKSGDQITMGTNQYNIGCDSRSSNNSCNGNDCVCNGTSCVNKSADYINYQIKYSYDLENYHKDTDFTGYYPFGGQPPRDPKTTAYISQLYGDDTVSRNTNIKKDYKKRLIPGLDYSKDSVCGCSLDRVSGEGGNGCLEVAANSDLCSGNGTRLNNGTCSCNSGYSGTTCNSCASTHYGYPNCQAKLPEDASCSSNEQCISNSCTDCYGFCSYSCN